LVLKPARRWSLASFHFTLEFVALRRLCCRLPTCLLEQTRSLDANAWRLRFIPDSSRFDNPTLQQIAARMRRLAAGIAGGGLDRRLGRAVQPTSSGNRQVPPY